MILIERQFLEDHDLPTNGFVIWNGKLILFDDEKSDVGRLIDALLTLDSDVIHNLVATAARKGHARLVWKSKSARYHYLPYLEIPDGDVWVCNSIFMEESALNVLF